MNYTVFVDDNFHYTDEDERYKLGEFDSLEEAIAACKKIVDSNLLANHKPEMTSVELYSAYCGFGEDPFIVVKTGEPPSFSAWDYARERCDEICRKGGDTANANKS